MKIIPTTIPGLLTIEVVRHGDHRGFFSEVYNRRDWLEAGLDETFVQDNHSLSVEKGTIRGLHFQTAPFEQAKLVRVVRGAILDVAVDLRRGSPTFGRHASVTLSAAEGNQLFMPVGFAHGFCSLEDNTEVLYKVTGHYSRAHDKGLAWDDPDLAIAWPTCARRDSLTEKDRNWPNLKDLPDYFEF